MITLAQQRAISDAVLLSGDEDLREGVRTAQDYGVRIVLVGIECTRGHNQSEELVLEADQLHVLKATDLKAAFQRRAELATAPDEPLVDRPELAVSRRAAEFAHGWLANATEAELNDLMAQRPRIPPPLDRELLTALEAQLGASLKGQAHLRHRGRDTFWGVIGGARSS